MHPSILGYINNLACYGGCCSILSIMHPPVVRPICLARTWSGCQQTWPNESTGTIGRCNDYYQFMGGQGDLFTNEFFIGLHV